MYGRLVDGESEWEDETFVPDKVLNHGDLIETNEYSIEVVHTPGHASNHLCFYLKEQKLIAVDSVNNPKEFLICRKLVENKVKISSDDILNQSKNLNDLII